MESVDWIAAVGAGIGERSDQVQILNDGAWVAVGQDQRQGVRLGRLDVEEVNRLPVDDGGELREGVELRLLRPPIELGSPIVEEILQVVAGNTAAPATSGELLG